MIWASIRSRCCAALLETVHGVTLAKVGGGDDPALSDEEREALAEWAGRLSLRGAAPALAVAAQGP